MAELTGARLQELLVFCHLEQYAEDATTVQRLGMIYDQAVGYFPVTRTAANAARYDAVINNLCSCWYDDRELPAYVQRLMNQLKTDPVSNLDTGGGGGDGA